MEPIKAFAVMKNGKIIAGGPASYMILGNEANKVLFDESDYDDVKPVTITFDA